MDVTPAKFRFHCVCCGLRTDNFALFEDRRISGPGSRKLRLACCVRCQAEGRNLDDGAKKACACCGGPIPGTPEYDARQAALLAETRYAVNYREPDGIGGDN
jgi:hypothetical protein